MGGLFGSGPSVVQSPPPPSATVSQLSPAQTQVQNLLANLMQQFLPGAFSKAQTGTQIVPSTTGGQFAAPLTGQQTGLIDSVVNQAQNPNSGANAPLTGANDALTRILSGQPQDFSQYFLQDIAQPQEQVFQQQTLPAIKAAMARSAGGTNTMGDDTGYQGAVTHATEDLNRNLQQSATALGTQATTTAAAQQVAGVQAAPGISSAVMNNLIGALGPAGLPQQVAQTQLGGQFNQGNIGLQFLESLLGGSTGLSTAPTMNTVTGSNQVLQGQTGFLPSFASSAAGNTGLGLGIGALLAGSDPRLKDVKGEKKKPNNALDVIRKLTVKEAKYKGEPESNYRKMLMADNVERIYPQAATRVNDVGFIKPYELIALLVKGVQELDKEAA